jgi:hypothetical protein
MKTLMVILTAITLSACGTVAVPSKVPGKICKTWANGSNPSPTSISNNAQHSNRIRFGSGGQFGWISGIARMFDKGVQTIQNHSKELAQ